MSKNYPPGVTGNEPQITGELYPGEPKPSPRQYGVKHSRRAEVTQVTDHHTYVTDETGQTHTLTKGSIDATPHPVGTKGLIQYVTAPSYGLWFFKADAPMSKTTTIKGYVHRNQDRFFGPPDEHASMTGGRSVPLFESGRFSYNDHPALLIVSSSEDHPEVPEWISVEERLPKPGEQVNVCYRTRQVDTTWRDIHSGKWVCDERDTVTHWMPLPSPPIS